MNYLLAIVIVFLPGLCWWAWFKQADDDLVEMIAKIIGVSVGSVSLLAIFFYLMKLSVSPIMLFAYAGLGSVLVLIGLVRNKNACFTWKGWIAFLFVGAIIGWRFWQARDLVLPNWVDSLHHSLIVRKMVEAGGLTATLEPYLPGPFYYHYAFHSFTALFSQLSGLDPARSVLVVGQVLIASISLGVYSLTKSLTRDWRSAAIAALFVTFVTKMPGYYLSWGRYTLVTGVLLLSLAIAQTISVWREKPDWKQAVALLLLVVGTLLSHYLAAFLLAGFLLLLGIGWVVITSLLNRKWHWQQLVGVVAPVLIGFLLTLPWYLRVFRFAGNNLNLGSFRPLDGINEGQWKYLLELIGPKSAYPLMAIGLVGLIWFLTQKNLRIFGVWGILIVGLALPFSLQLTPFRSDYYGLVVFLPVSISAAVLLVWFADGLARLISRPRWAVEPISVALVLCLVVAGVSANVSAVNPGTILADQDDVRALDWINEHLPKDARFFINTTPWGYGIYRGVDGGAWILPYTGRWAIVPTIFYPFGMRKGDEKTAELGEKAYRMTNCSDKFWDIVKEADLQYVYLKQDSGVMNTSQSDDCIGLDRIYNMGKVSIWLILSMD